MARGLRLQLCRQTGNDLFVSIRVCEERKHGADSSDNVMMAIINLYLNGPLPAAERLPAAVLLEWSSSRIMMQT